MSIDRLQEKIRKLKNPSIVDFGNLHIPSYILAEEETYPKAYERTCRELLSGLKNVVPAVRFHLNTAVLLGEQGSRVLKAVLNCAKSNGFYTLLDLPGFSSPMEADAIAGMLFAEESGWLFDGLILQPYLGTDCIKPFCAPALGENKTVFLLARTANKSATELQDLLTGSRVVHQTVVETAKRLGNNAFGKCHYNEIGALVSATAASAVRNIRTTFPEVFLIMDGIDCVGGNASNCSKGFDRLGHGGAACAGSSVTDAWMMGEREEIQYVDAACQAAERMKKNLTRYIEVL